MYIIKYSSNHIFLIIFLFSQALMLFLGIGYAKGIENININYAILYHVLFTLIFVFGYFYANNTKSCTLKREFVLEVVPKSFFYFSYVLILVGVLVSALSIAAVSSLKHYFYMLSHYGDYYQDLRRIKYRAFTEGLSGAVKVFGYAPLGVFFFTSTLRSFYAIPNSDLKKQLNSLLVFAIVGVLSKTFFSMDRLSLLGVLVVLVYALFGIKGRFRFYLLGIMGVIFMLLSHITSLKMKDLSVIDFLKLYCKLGLNNFELVLKGFSNFSLGFNTFLTPLYFIAKFFGYRIDIPQSEDFVWDNAHYFYSYLYMDFGIFSFVVMFVLGMAVNKYQQLVNDKNKFALCFYFLVLFTICTLIVVPIIRSVEFWLMIIISFISYCFGFYKISNYKPKTDENNL